MNIRYDTYARIKDNVCIVYDGHCPEYLILMKLVRPAISRSLSGLALYLCAQDHLMHLFDGEENVVPLSKLDTKHEFFGYVKKIPSRMDFPHPIELLLSESNIELPTICKVATKNSNLCCIFSQGELPTRSLTEQELNKCQSFASQQGYDIWVNPSLESAKDAGWVIGVESPALFDAASRAIKTTLIPTGIGEMVYRKMFPAGEILKNIIS